MAEDQVTCGIKREGDKEIVVTISGLPKEQAAALIDRYLFDREREEITKYSHDGNTLRFIPRLSDTNHGEYPQHFATWYEVAIVPYRYPEMHIGRIVFEPVHGPDYRYYAFYPELPKEYAISLSNLRTILEFIQEQQDRFDKAHQK